MSDWHSSEIEAFDVISFVSVEICMVTVGPQVALALTSTRCTFFFLLKKNLTRTTQIFIFENKHLQVVPGYALKYPVQNCKYNIKR